MLQHSSLLYYHILLTQHNSSLPSHDLNHISPYNVFPCVQGYTNTYETRTELHLHLVLAWNTENVERKCRWLMALSHSSTIIFCTERSSVVVRGCSYLLLSCALLHFAQFISTDFSTTIFGVASRRCFRNVSVWAPSELYKHKRSCVETDPVLGQFNTNTILGYIYPEPVGCCDPV